MSKKDPILVALAEYPEKWNEFLLKSYGLPQDPSTRKEIQQDSLRDGRGRRLTLDEVGESATLADELISLHQEAAANESTTLSPEWLRYLEYMDVIAEELSPEDKGAALKQLALAHARSLYWEQPPDVFRPMNAPLGTSAEFRQHWFYGELEIRTRCDNRRHHLIEIWQLPPAEPEDLDEAGETERHWDGLTWIPGTPESSSS